MTLHQKHCTCIENNGQQKSFDSQKATLDSVCSRVLKEAVRGDDERGQCDHKQHHAKYSHYTIETKSFSCISLQL